MNFRVKAKLTFAMEGEEDAGGLERFLRARDVAAEDIHRMRRDKIDMAVLLVMSDEEMAQYVPSYGDRVALLSYCRQSNINQSKETLLERVRNKIGQLKKKKIKNKSHEGVRNLGESSASCSSVAGEEAGQMARTGNINAVKKARRIEIGWLNFADDEYHQVRTKSGGGTRQASVDKSTTVEEILKLGKELFFPKSTSTKGNAEDFMFEMCDFKRKKLDLECTVGQLYEETKIKMLRLYVCTKEKAPEQSQSEERSASEMEKLTPNTSAAASSLIIHLENGNSSNTNQEGDFHVKKKKKTDAREDEQVFPNINVRDCDDNGDDDLDETVSWDHGLSETFGDDSDVIIINYIDEDVQSAVRSDSSDVSFAQCQPPESTTSEENLDNVDSSQREVPPLSSNSQASQVGPSQHQEHRNITIRRVVVLQDLVQAFMEGGIMDDNVTMEFVNERAVDGAGVSRDVYTSFWEQFLEHCEGETERVPRLRPDFGENEWRAIGRIWVKGLVDHGVVPVLLSQSFIIACIHGVDAVDSDDLITSFLYFLSPAEKSVIEGALKGAFEDADTDDLLEIFSRMGSHKLPTKENMQQAIAAMAHKAILQEAKYVIDCFSTQMSQVKILLPDKESVMAMYKVKRVSGKKLSQLFETSKMILSQMERASFTYLQRYARSSDQTKAEKILRFCTGSSVVTVDKITVSFSGETGLSRRPVGHTCGALLELPCTYCSYPEFRTEFDNILASNYLEMDIL